MKKITVLIIILFGSMIYAQVGVNTTTPDPSSMLDISATNKGVLVPRVSLANVTATMLDGTNTAATGLLIWNTNAATVGGNGVGFYFFNGTQWIPITQTITGNTLDQSYDQGGAGAGRTITADNGAVLVQGNDGFQNTGTFGSGAVLGLSGSGTRMFFYPRKAAFRAGNIVGTLWNDANIGNYSVAMGRSTSATNEYDVAIGFGSSATGSYSTALGWANTASGTYSFSMGQNSVASGWSSTVLGRISNALADNSLVFGNNSTTNGQFSFAIGNYAETFGTNSMAFGNNVTSRSGYESVFGIHNTDYTPLSVGGFNNADRLFVIGNGTNATNLSNALTIYKDGRMNINDAYTMPTSDGINGQVMQTNGAGNVSWATPTTGTDDQNLIAPTLVGTTLNLNIENGTGTSIDLAPLQDGTGTDDQTIDNFSLSGTTLRLSLENDGQPLQTVNLASLAGTDDQNLVTPTLVGTTLNLNIENGLGTSIDLASLDTDNQQIDVLSLTGDTLNISLQDDGVPTQTLNLTTLKNTLDQSYDQGGAGAGKNIDATDGAVRINGVDGFLVTGTVGTGNTIDTEITGIGTRMFFNPRKSAFRAGYVSGNQWDNTGIGNFSTAFGSSTIAIANISTAFGFNSVASGLISTAFGNSTNASGENSTAFGDSTNASGVNSTAFGDSTNASGVNSTAFGTITRAIGDDSTAFGRATEASGERSTAFGFGSDASGSTSTAFGYSTTASGSRSTAFGFFSDATGDSASTAFGYFASASGSSSTAFGYYTSAIGEQSTAFGNNTTSFGVNSTAFGNETMASGLNSTAFGNSTTASGVNSTAFGYFTDTTGDNSTAFGYFTDATGENSTAFGYNTSASNLYSTAFGYFTNASGNSSTAFGYSTNASGFGSTAFGNNTSASVNNSTAFGSFTTASGNNSTAFGFSTNASAATSTAFGSITTASGVISTAFGDSTTASGDRSTAFGIRNTAPSLGETVLGIGATDYTLSTNGSTQFRSANASDRLFVIGNAIDLNNNNQVDTSERRDALVMLKNGNTGLGSSTPEERLHVVGNIRMVDGNQATGRVMKSDANGTASWQIDNDNQAIDVFGLTGTTLNLSLSNDGVPTQTVNLTSLANDWKLTGNTGTTPTTNFIGTTDNQDLSIRTNNTEKVRITAKGQIETTQLQSVWIGSSAGENATGTRNVFVGNSSGLSTSTGSDNTAIGGLTLLSNTTGFDNTAIGLASLYFLSSGDGNTAIGEQTLENFTTGSYNTFVGHLAGENYPSGLRNTVMGFQAGQNASGDGNVFIGSNAGRNSIAGNRLFIENNGADENNALIYGEFDNDILRTNSEFQVRQNSSGTLSHVLLREEGANDGARIKFTNAAEVDNEWVLYGRADNTVADSRFHIFHNGTGDILRITGNGLVGIMRTPTTNALEVNGNASKTVAGGFLANSDSRLKKDISTISPNEALDKILKLRGVTYYWNDDKTGTVRPQNLQMGFIAQEIAEVFPDKVTEDNLGYLQTAYGDYDPIVFQAIKALNEKIEKLEKENAALKSALEKINALEAKLEQMNIK